MKNKKTIGVIAVLIALFGGLIASRSVEAHHPNIVTSVVCDTDGDGQTVTDTLTADAVRGYTWSANGSTPKPDNQPISISYNFDGDATVAPAVTYMTIWWNEDGVVVAGDNRSRGAVTLRTDCEPPTETTLPTETTEVTETTVVETTLPTETTEVTETTDVVDTTVVETTTPDVETTAPDTTEGPATTVPTDSTEPPVDTSEPTTPTIPSETTEEPTTPTDPSEPTNPTVTTVPSGSTPTTATPNPCNAPPGVESASGCVLPATGFFGKVFAIIGIIVVAFGVLIFWFGRKSKQ